MDKLTVKGLPPLDGDYEFDIVELLVNAGPQALTNREGHRIKVMSGIRAGEIEEAFAAGDSDLLVALAAVILTRAGKRVDEEKLWDAPMGSVLQFEIADRRAEEGEGDETGPPAQVPPPNEPIDLLSRSGGASGSPISDTPQENDPSPTGPQDSVRSADSPPLTSVG